VVIAVLWQPFVRVLWLDVALPLADNLGSAIGVLGKALWAVAYALTTRPTMLIVLGYALLALALCVLWTRVVFRPKERRA